MPPRRRSPPPVPVLSPWSLTDVGRSKGHDARQAHAENRALAEVEQAERSLRLERGLLEPFQRVVVSRRLVRFVVEVLDRLVVHEGVRYL